MKLLKYLSMSVLTVALVACGGGGGSSGTTAGTGTGTGTGTVVPVAADFIFELDKSTILNTGNDKALVTVTALDSNRNVVAGVPVSVAVDAGGVFASNLGVNTDAKGQFSGSISIGGDKTNRTINATILVNGISKIASIIVTGSQITVIPLPATPAPGQLVTLNIATTDSAGVAIQNTALVLSGTSGASGSVITDLSGNKVVVFSAPAVAGSYEIVVKGLGVSTTKLIEVIAATSSGKPVVPDSVVISSASLNPLPTSILANATGSNINRSKLSAKFLTTGNAAIPNMRVRFEIVEPALGSGETISTGTATVYTDSSGTAEADYIAGTRTSPTNGVTIRACFKRTDFSSKTECLPSQLLTANLTVAGTPLSITITDNNKLEKGLGEIAYLKKFLIQVNDSSGVAVKDAIISASVDITHYGKGLTWTNLYRDVSIPEINNFHADYLPQPPPVGAIQNLSSSSYAPLNDEKIWCINEDWNRNGFRDGQEDWNRDGILQPRKAEIIVSYVNGNKTDANGQMLVQITYGQNMGSWLAYTLRATTGVAGSEGDASKSYVTDVLKEDVGNGSFLTPPFGSKACNARN
ncbi:hypothetical protein RCH06_002343 [Polaromonas sp. CG_9.5]|uniref:hypothetical protein n=1 Tax=Polaromonas sp. CG_9.5 TaxID=3071705 RepID=UPI002DFC028A|nr:hypothetical protein [Polaromonas sp. CG_9.5]